MPTATAEQCATLGQYELIEKIAEGGMGSVYKAKHCRTGAVVAIKVLPPELCKNAVLMRRFEQEFRSAASLDHPNVVKGLDYSDCAPSPYLVMEYVPGKSLGQRVETYGPMDYREAVYVISQVSEGLHSAHKQGLIHRDIKPDNILVMPNLQAKITDLGLVRDVDSDEQLTRTGRGLGTPYYMAPEQFRNAKNVDVRSDVYSLGATLFVMLTGKIPFEKCSPLDCWVKKTKDDYPAPRSLNPKIPLRADQAIRRAMSANPAQRPKSCREFMEDLLGERWHPQLIVGNKTHIPGVDNDLWYVVFYDQGFPKTVKGSTAAVVKNITSGALGDLSIVLVSRSKAGPFEKVLTTSEFGATCQSCYASSEQVGDALSMTDLNRMSGAISQSPSGATSTEFAALSGKSRPPVKPTGPPSHSRVAPTNKTDIVPNMVNRSVSTETPAYQDVLATTQAVLQVPSTQPNNYETPSEERPKLSTRTDLKPVAAVGRVSEHRLMHNTAPNAKILWCLVGLAALSMLGVIVGLLLSSI